MREQLAGPGSDARGRTRDIIRERQGAIAADAAVALAQSSDILDADGWRDCADVVLRILAVTIDTGRVDGQSIVMRDLSRFCPPLTTHSLVDVLHTTERVLLDEIAIDDEVGA